MSKKSLSSTLKFFMCSKHSALQSRFFWGQGRNITQIFKVKLIFFICICAGMSLSCSVTTLLYVFLKVKTVHENLKSPSALSVQSLSERSVLMCVWLLGWRSLTIRGSRSRMLTPPLQTPQVANPRGLVQSARKKKWKNLKNQITYLKGFITVHGDKLLGKKKYRNH